MSKYRETIRRTVRTFIQSASGYMVANTIYIFSANNWDMNFFKTALGGLGIAAITAGIAAVMNLPDKNS